MTIDLPDRLAGGIWGHLVGDATGVPYEGRPPMSPGAVVFGLEGGSWHQPPGTWSDDGALMLALLDSLLSSGFDLDDQARRIRAWYETSAYTPDGDVLFDVGGTTRRAIERLQSGLPPADAGPDDERANGNGSLMRIVPLPLVMRHVDDDKLAAMARLASRVTHGTATAQLTCALYVLVARRLLAGAGRQAALADATATLTAIVDSGGDVDGADRETLAGILGWRERRGRGYVVDSFWSAWDALASASSYEETIRRAVALGRDTDTTAAIAGGLAGIRFGWKGIPMAWRTGLRDQAQVARLVDRLVETDGVATSSSRPYRVDFVELARTPIGAAWSGRLGMTILPGQKRWSLRRLPLARPRIGCRTSPRRHRRRHPRRPQRGSRARSGRRAGAVIGRTSGRPRAHPPPGARHGSAGGPRGVRIARGRHRREAEDRPPRGHLLHGRHRPDRHARGLRPARGRARG